MVLCVLVKVIQRNATFGMSDHLEMHLDHMRMPAGNGRMKANWRLLDVMTAIKKSIVKVKAPINCLTYGFIIVMAYVNGFP